MPFARDAETIVRRVQMKHTDELVQEGSCIALRLERSKEQGVDEPMVWGSWLKGVWLMGVYERELTVRNLTGLAQ